MGLIKKQFGSDLDHMINNWISESGLRKGIGQFWSQFIEVQENTHEILPGNDGVEEVVLKFLSRYEGELPPYIGFKFNTTSRVRLTFLDQEHSIEGFIDRLNNHADSLLGLHNIEILSSFHPGPVQYIKFDGKFVKKENQAWD